MTVQRYENGQLYPADTEKTNIYNGLLVCHACKRWYPIEDSVLLMLPDNLIEDDRQQFLIKYGDAFIREMHNTEKVLEKKKDKKTIANEDWLKKNEMEKRDEQATMYHKFGSKIHDITEKNHFLRILKPEYDEVVIELGCGTGRITEDFSGKVANYIAMDFSRKSLVLLKEKIQDDILLLKGDVCNLPIKDGIASNVISAQVFEHVPGKKEQEEFVKEMKRILISSGQAVLTIYNYSIEKRLQKEIQKKGFHANKIYYEHFTRNEVLNHFKNYFEILELRGINCYLPRISKVKSYHFRQLIENVLSGTFMNSLLGNIWLLSLRK